MKNYQTEYLAQYISNLRISRNLSRLAYQAGNALYLNNQCVLLSREGQLFSFTVEDNYQDFFTSVLFDHEQKKIEPDCNCKAAGFCSHKVAALLQLHEDLSQELAGEVKTGMKYTREGMIMRVMTEREEKAKNEKYVLDFADNIYGEHLITNQQNRTYTLTFYDFEKKQGYCSCPDHQTNKLGTCKHLIYAFDNFQKSYPQPLNFQQEFPFLEVFLHPLKDYRISYFFPGKFSNEIQSLVNKYFDENQQVSNKKITDFQNFINEAVKYKFIKIRQEVFNKIKKETELLSLIELKNKTTLNYNNLNADLYPYQKEGIEFLVFKKGAILADEVGLGKTRQAILTAHFKKEILNLQNTLIVCPDNLIEYWKTEIVKTGDFTFSQIKESKDFFSDDSFFKIIGFDDFARHSFILDSYSPDFLIIDEAQKISNFDSDLVRILRRVKYRHLLIITDSKPENNLMQYYSMLGLIDNSLLTPLWEFSYQHCLFDSQILDKIVGYYNQEKIVRRIQSIYLRREKTDIIDQLKKISPLLVTVNPVEIEQIGHQKIIRETLFLLNKKIKTSFDWQNIEQFILQMKALGSLVYLPGEEGVSAKFIEFRHFLLEKLNLQNTAKKIIVFAEKEETQKQLIRYFKEIHIQAEILNQTLDEADLKSQTERFLHHKTAAILIFSEGFYLNVLKADAFVYYDICLNLAAIEKRIYYLQENFAVQAPLVINFINQNTLEYFLYQLSKEKKALFNEFVLFITKSGDKSELSNEAQTELIRFLNQIAREKQYKPLKNTSGQTSLFDLTDENKPLSLSGEEHKVFDSPFPLHSKINLPFQKESPENDLNNLFQQAHTFLSSLYFLQTGKELPWKPEDIEMNIKEKEIILRIKRI
jgi:hypothetical protein